MGITSKEQYDLAKLNHNKAIKSLQTAVSRKFIIRDDSVMTVEEILTASDYHHELNESIKSSLEIIKSTTYEMDTYVTHLQDTPVKVELSEEDKGTTYNGIVRDGTINLYTSFVPYSVCIYSEDGSLNDVMRGGNC